MTEGARAAALWLLPGVEPDGDAIEALIGETVEAEKIPDVAAMFEEMEKYHPSEPCWYLPMIAADPAHMGRGLGAALMKHALARCDADGMTAYLESSNPRNISLYERHGFEVMGEIRSGKIPVMTPMIRMARR
jgi:GNAT superfamily N-acetyltransferase